MKKIKLLITIFILFPFFAHAVGVSVSPSKLEISYPSAKYREINIKNISQEPISVSIFADDFGDKININPNEFQLMPDETTNVKIEFNSKKINNEVLQTNISIVSKALDKKSFNAASGIKIPFVVYANEKNNLFSLLKLLILIFITLFVIFILIPHKKAKQTKLVSVFIIFKKIKQLFSKNIFKKISNFTKPRY